MPQKDQELSTREDRYVPAAVRQEVLERDGSCCRVCGRYVEHPALHHIDYRSQGGRHVPENLVTIGWLPGHDCHLPVVHANKRLWQPILQVVAITPGITAFQVRRQLGRLRDNGRSRDTREFLEAARPPRALRPLIGWPQAEPSAHPPQGLSGPSADGTKQPKF